MLVRTAAGFTLLEVLVALVLVSIGLLGYAGLQVRAQQTEIEAYQRAQALTLVADITARINLNRVARRCYVTTDALGQQFHIGAGTDNFPACVGFGDNETRALADADIAQWDDLLDGASESLGGADAGGLLGARGCITFDAPTGSLTVTLAWQGETPSGAPPANPCGEGAYGDERLRRTLSETLQFAALG